MSTPKVVAKVALDSPEETSLLQLLKDEPEVVEVRTKYNLSDVTVRRFLRGRKHDLESAKRGILRHGQWREEEHVADIKESSIEHELKLGKIQVHGQDKSRRPVVYIFAQRHNKDQRDLEEMKRFIIFTLEKALRETVPEEEKIIIVFDLTGFGLRCMDYDVVKMLINILGFNYPETLMTAYVVNAPFLFWACWAIIKPWLDPVTAAKVQMAKKDDLLTVISPEQLHQTVRPARLDGGGDGNNAVAKAEAVGNVTPPNAALTEGSLDVPEVGPPEVTVFADMEGMVGGSGK